MTRARFYYCTRCDELHQRVAYRRNCDDEPPQRSDFPAPYVISDTLPGGVNGLYHHAACRKIDSKSEYRRVTKDHGCVELGNELAAASAPMADTQLAKDSIESAVNDALHQHGISSESDMSKVDYGPD